MKNILVIQQKGGCGKSTVALEIVRSLQRTHTPLNFYDLDKQSDSHAIIKSFKEPNAEYSVIDSPGALREKMGEWVSESDLIVIPTRCSRMDIDPLVRTLNIAKTSKKPSVPIFIVLNQYTQWKSSREFLDWIARQNTGAMILTLPQSELFLQAQANGESVVDFKRKSNAAKASLSMINAIREAIGLSEETI